MRYLYVILFFFLVGPLLGQNTVPHPNNPQKKIGYIKPEPDLDDPSFTVCDEKNIHEYYQVNPQFGEGIISIQQYFKPKLGALNSMVDSNGLIVVRFVINCEGEVGRLRSQFFDKNYKKQQHNMKLQSKLIELVKMMGAWQPGNYQRQNFDSYQHIKFRIKENEVSDIFF